MHAPRAVGSFVWMHPNATKPVQNLFNNDKIVRFIRQTFKYKQLAVSV